MRIATSPPPGRPPSGSDSPLAARRDRIVTAALRAVMWVGLVAYVPSVWAGWLVGYRSIIVLDTVAYVTLVVAYLRPGTSYRARAGLLVGLSYALALALSMDFGPHAAGALWLLGTPILTAALFDLRATLRMLALTVVTIVLVGWAQAKGILTWQDGLVSLDGWVLFGSNAILLSTALALTVASLIRGLHDAAAESEEHRAALAVESRRLALSNAQLEAEMERRERAEADLRQAEKLQAVGIHVAGIVHDINNLLTPILAGAEVLSTEPGLKSDGAGMVDRIVTSARSGRDLVRRLLAFSRPAGEERHPLDAAATFGEAARLLRAVLPGDVDLRFESGDDVGAVVLTPADVQQIVLNLGGNAAKAMPGGGVLRISVTDAPDRSSERESSMVSGPCVRVRVTDTGAGMSEEVLRRAMEPYFTTRPDAGGNGIGLSTVRSVAEGAGGEVRIWSTRGVGTTVDVLLPRVDLPVEDFIRHSASSAPFGDGSHILVVDDEDAVRETVVRVLERRGFRASSAPDGRTALAMTSAAGFAAVVTDLSMPHMGGLALARRLRHKHPDLAIVLTSGLVDEDLRRNATLVGVQRVVPKPFEVDELLVAVGDALAMVRQPDGAGGA